jgi:hypothetical protein
VSHKRRKKRVTPFSRDILFEEDGYDMPRGVRFQHKGRQLVVSVRIGFDPTIDRDLIDLLRDAPEGGMATVIRTLMRAGLQVTTPAALEASDRGPAVEVIDDSVNLRNRDVQADGELQTVVVYRHEIPDLIRRLAIAAAQLNGYRTPLLPHDVREETLKLSLPLPLESS